jgi:hypothetical protein
MPRKNRNTTEERIKWWDRLLQVVPNGGSTATSKEILWQLVREIHADDDPPPIGWWRNNHSGFNHYCVEEQMKDENESFYKIIWNHRGLFRPTKTKELTEWNRKLARPLMKGMKFSVMDKIRAFLPNAKEDPFLLDGFDGQESLGSGSP